MKNFRNLITRINGAVGSNMFRNYYNDDGVDILQNGDLSCAFFVSVILHSMNLLASPHCTVSGTIQDLEESGWYKIKKLKKGCVILWEPITQNGKSHYHIGFYIGEQQAVSNRSSLGVPGEHMLHYSGLDKEGKKRRAKIASLYWHPSLG